MINRIFLTILMIFSLSFAQSQDNIDYEDKNYDSTIGNVEFRYRGQQTRYPMMNLNGRTKLVLNFDDFRDEIRYLYYKVILCNADWTPSDLDETNYIKGFNDNEIEDSEFSFNTRAEFANYQLELPNEDIEITLSGNYLLYVYDSDTDEPVLTKRFLVLDEKFVVNSKVVPTAMVDKRNTHHEIDFEIQTLGENVSNPEKQLNVVVLQNWRWDKAIRNLTPRFAQKDLLNFDYTNKILFDAGNEFRWVDLRSMRFLSPGMEHIDILNDGYGVRMKMDKSRGDQVYFNYNDLNGDHVILNTDDPNIRDTFQFRSSSNNQLEVEQATMANFDLDVKRIRNNMLRADYANVYLKLAALQELYQTDIYIVGTFCNWKLLEENRMIYDVSNNWYAGAVELKQGYYDYAYATVEKGKNEYTLMDLEGSHFETENEYIVLVYFRGTTDRHDRLIGYRSIFSGRQR